MNEQEMASLGDQIDYLSQRNVAGLGRCGRFYTPREESKKQSLQDMGKEDLKEELKELAEQRSRLTVLNVVSFCPSCLAGPHWLLLSHRKARWSSLKLSLPPPMTG